MACRIAATQKYDTNYNYNARKEVIYKYRVNLVLVEIGLTSLKQ